MPLHQMVFSRTVEGTYSREGRLQQMLLGKAEIHIQKGKRKPQLSQYMKINSNGLKVSHVRPEA